MTTPATAGPTTREALKRLAFRATAFGSSSRPTIWKVSACRPGASKTSAVPPSAARAYACHTSAAPVKASTASASETSIDAAWVVITSLRLSNRSATTPAKSPKIVNGTKRQNASTPTASGDEVSPTTNQASAMFCIQVPTSDMSWPVKKSR